MKMVHFKQPFKDSFKAITTILWTFQVGFWNSQVIDLWTTWTIDLQVAFVHKNINPFGAGYVLPRTYFDRCHADLNCWSLKLMINFCKNQERDTWSISPGCVLDALFILSYPGYRFEIATFASGFFFRSQVCVQHVTQTKCRKLKQIIYKHSILSFPTRYSWVQSQEIHGSKNHEWYHPESSQESFDSIMWNHWKFMNQSS